MPRLRRRRREPHSTRSPMTDPQPSFTPESPDPRLEALDDEIANLIAEALFDHLLRHGLHKPQSDEENAVDNRP